MTVEVLRKVLPREIANELWQKARIGVGVKAKRCPACQRLMTQVPVIVAEEPEFIDVCTGCHFMWFDPAEFEQFPRIEIPKSDYEKLSDKAKRELASANLTLAQQQQLPKDGIYRPAHWWQIVITLFGMPIEYNAVPLRQKPVVTWTLAVIIAAVSIIAFLNLEQAVTKFGLIPSRFTRDFGFTFISSFFLHAGLLHLLGNLYFLLVFGDNTEDILGRKKYLLLIILSALVGDIAHILSSPHSAVPSIGASGGISGILAYYCLRFPKARVGLFLWFCWIRIPVVLMFVFWVLIQILYAYLQKYGLSNIAAFAHLGGAFVGIFFWLISRRSVFISPEPDEFINNC